MPSPSPESVASASVPVICTRASPTRRSRAAARAAASASGFSSGAGRPGGGRTIAAAVRPSSETSSGPAASREPGTAAATRSNARATAGSRASVPSTTATIGAITPPLPKRSTISSLASNAGRPGASNDCDSAPDSPLEAHTPAIARRSHAPATSRRRRRTRSVRRVTTPARVRRYRRPRSTEVPECVGGPSSGSTEMSTKAKSARSASTVMCTSAFPSAPMRKLPIGTIRPPRSANQAS